MVDRCVIACALLLMGLAGCAAPSRFEAGQLIPAPPGWVEYCKREPMDPGCTTVKGQR